MQETPTAGRGVRGGGKVVSCFERVWRFLRADWGRRLYRSMPRLPESRKRHQSRSAKIAYRTVNPRPFTVLCYCASSAVHLRCPDSTIVRAAVCTSLLVADCPARLPDRRPAAGVPLTHLQPRKYPANFGLPSSAHPLHHSRRRQHV
jgi:hypothetical protein